MLVVRTPAVVDHCRSFLVFLTGSLSALDLARIDSLAPESTRALPRKLWDYLPFLPAGMNNLTKIIQKETETQTFQSDYFCQTGNSSRQEG